MLEGTHFLLTGATGRLGSGLSQRLEDLGASVSPLVMAGYPPRPKRVPWPALTPPILVRSAGDLRALPRPDYVVHLHWLVDRSGGAQDPGSTEFEPSVLDMAFLWEWLARSPFRRLINISSIKVFGQGNAGQPISRQTEPRPDTPYGRGKASAEAYFDHHFEGGALAHLRLGHVASGGEHESQLMTRLYTSAFEGARMIVNQGHVTHVMFIEEALDLIIQAAIGGSERRYNLVAPGYPNEWIARRFEEVSGRSLNAEFRDLTPGQADLVFDSHVEELRADWVRRIAIEETIRRIIQHYQAEVR